MRACSHHGNGHLCQHASAVNQHKSRHDHYHRTGRSHRSPAYPHRPPRMSCLPAKAAREKPAGRRLPAQVVPRPSPDSAGRRVCDAGHAARTTSDDTHRRGQPAAPSTHDQHTHGAARRGGSSLAGQSRPCKAAAARSRLSQTAAVPHGKLATTPWTAASLPITTAVLLLLLMTKRRAKHFRSPLTTTIVGQSLDFELLAQTKLSNFPHIIKLIDQAYHSPILCLFSTHS